MAFALTPGNIAEISMAIHMLERVAPPRRLVAARAYDAEKMHSWRKIRRIATRYNRMAKDFFAAVCLAATVSYRT
jgi:hypothetical protein